MKLYETGVEFTNKLVHKWRFEESAILVGTNTIVTDDPLLTNRLWNGKNPLRLIIDKDLKLPATAKVFNKDGNIITYSIIKFAPNSPVTDDLFTFNKDKFPGVEVVDLR